MTDDLLDLLRCPLTWQRLRVATVEVLAQCVPVLAEGLVREDGAVVYPIVQGIPQLRPGDAVAVPPGGG